MLSLTRSSLTFACSCFWQVSHVVLSRSNRSSRSSLWKYHVVFYDTVHVVLRVFIIIQRCPLLSTNSQSIMLTLNYVLWLWLYLIYSLTKV